MGERRLLLVVDDTFEIRGRGLVVVPLLDVAEAKLGTVECELSRPDGSTLRAKGFVGVEFVSPTPPKPHAVMMIREVSKVDVPIGTEVWITEP